MITVIGSANIDLTFRSPRLPRPGETIIGTGYFQGFGGKGANQAVAAVRLGEPVAFVGRVGRDDFGRATREQLGREGIDVTHLGEDLDRPTGTAAILVDNQGANSIVVVPGANEGLSVDDVRTAADAIRASRVVVAQCETPIDATAAAFRIARSAGSICLFNPAPARTLPDDLLALVDVLVPNESEASHLTGLSIESTLPSAQALRARGPATVIVTLGGDGVLYLGPEGEFQLPAIPVQAVDTSGAGDAFCGALAVELARGSSIRSAIERANRVAALSVTRLGTQASFPTSLELTGNS